MKLKTNSWYYKLWDMSYDFPVATNLCPFFWKLLFAMLFFPINFIISIPWYIFQGFVVDEEDWNDSISAMPFFTIKLGVSIFFNIAIFWGTCMILMFWNIPDKSANFIFALGIAGWGILFLVGVKYLIELINKKRKVKSPNILIEYVKSVKNKYCPIIEWE